MASEGRVTTRDHWCGKCQERVTADHADAGRVTTCQRSGLSVAGCKASDLCDCFDKGREATGPVCVECGAPIRVEVDLHVCDLCETGRSMTPQQHDYLSTACGHLLHDHCRLVCKFCDSPCTCRCHLSPPARKATP